MDRKIALKWARALESGKYKQAQGTLRVDDAFCCLGVLCNLHAQAHPEIAAQEEDPNTYLGEEVTLPLPVMEWAGIRFGDNGTFGEGFRLEVPKGNHRQHVQEYANDLIELNDHFEWDFKKIAAVIRKHSDKL